MTGAEASAVVVGVLLLAAGTVLVVVVRHRGAAGGVEAGTPDTVTADVVTGLLAELRGAQAETAYWKAQTQRLQQELDIERSRTGQEPPTQHP